MEPNPAIAIPDGHRQVAAIFSGIRARTRARRYLLATQEWRAQGIAFKDMAILTRTHKDLKMWRRAFTRPDFRRKLFRPVDFTIVEKF